MKILILELGNELQRSALQFFGRFNYYATIASTGSAAQDCLQQADFQLVVAEQDLLGMAPVRFVADLPSRCSFISVGGISPPEHDLKDPDWIAHLPKPLDVNHFTHALQAATRRALVPPMEDQPEFPPIISSALRESALLWEMGEISQGHFEARVKRWVRDEIEPRGFRLQPPVEHENGRTYIVTKNGRECARVSCTYPATRRSD